MSSQIESLAQKPEQKKALFALIQSTFPKGEAQSSPKDLDIEFSALLNQENHKRVLFICENESPVASVSWRPFKMPDGLMGAAIGLVVTHSDHQKNGYSKRLLAEAESRAKAEGAALACLWSNLTDFYEKRGYVLCGSELSWDISKTNFKESGDFTIEEASHTAIETFHSIYRDLQVGPLRESIDYERQLEQSDSEALLAKNKSGQIVAYAILGKGRDLRNVVHELIGDFEAFPSLLKVCQASIPSESDTPLRLQFPFSHPQTTALEHTLGAADQGAVCFAKVLELKPLVDVLNKELQSQGLKALNIVLPEIHDGLQPWCLKKADVEESLFISPDPAHLLQIFASPWPLEDIEGLSDEVKAALSSWTPYPLYFWGMDSV